MKYKVVIPNYNGSYLIIKNLPSVLDSLSEYKNSEIAIVDDGSHEEDFKKLEIYVAEIKEKSTIPIKLIRKDKNSGFSSTVNKGALDSETEYLILLNSDVSPEKNYLISVMEDFEKNEKLFGVGCMDKSEEETETVFRGRGLAIWSRGLLIHRKGSIEKSDTFWISGGSSIIKTEVFKKLGGFDEIYDPFYWEDIDLSYRARKLGYELMFENKSIVIHRHSEGAIRKNFSKGKVTKIAYRNQFIFIWKNITDTKLVMSHLLWLPYHLIKGVLRGDNAFLQGFLLALIRLPDIIKRRNNQKKYYKKSDSELLYSTNEIINNNTGI